MADAPVTREADAPVMREADAPVSGEADAPVSGEAEAPGRPRFDADPDEFRLAVEALRIRHAALYDPLAAVNSSAVQPLPHQIEAVYGRLLPQVPLRYVLADDPGAGKTIMAGLYLKELILRSDCERAIIVAPGSLVEQWRDELSAKFGLGQFEVLTRSLIDAASACPQDGAAAQGRESAAAGRNVFAQHPYLIVRLDQLSRDEAVLAQLREVRWDVAVVDEAHRLSAHYFGGDLKRTKRYRLGQVLSETARNLLLMTATPHAGKEDDFQLFMALLDPDRFEGQYRQGVHRTDTTGLMIRRTKEELLTFDGRHLFPERRAETVAYELSPTELDLYERVTDYVRTQMGRAQELSAAGDRKRGHTVGFALAVLQRRLASSPEAILRSLERRRERLARRLAELRHAAEVAARPSSPMARALGAELARDALADDDPPGLDLDDLDVDDSADDLTDDERARFDDQLDQMVDGATAAQTVEELTVEIGVLDTLVGQARLVRHLDEDRKWVELGKILDRHVLGSDVTGLPRKIIIFTEHRDTLTYLRRKIGALLGADAVVAIHGGLNRQARRFAQTQFTQESRVTVLLATDAAGEGLNLQRAHLMVNYDLPWNPNRIEQRFGRIHRIGQREVCHLWNLVAHETREGDVFVRLLAKIDQQAAAYRGNLFHVLGERDAFDNKPLRELIVEAIQYGDRPEVRARLDEVIDTACAVEAGRLANERMLNPELYPGLDIDAIRRLREEALERKLQPGYIRAFLDSALVRLGGLMRERETGRFQIPRVPPRLRDQARRANRWEPLPADYERVTFTPEDVTRDGYPDAALIAPGHPLLDAVIEATLADLGGVLGRGAVFVDRRQRQIPEPSLLFAVGQRIANPDGATLDRHFDFVELDRAGQVHVAVAPPYLDYEAPTADEAGQVTGWLGQDWVAGDHETTIRRWAFREGLRPRRAELETRLRVQAERVRAQVGQRLTAEINHAYAEYNRALEQERAGQARPRRRAHEWLRDAQEFEARLARRQAELDHAADLVELPATIRATALVIPARLLTSPGPGPVSERQARDTQAVERRGVEAVLAAERRLGRHPVEMDEYSPDGVLIRRPRGYDIRSTDADGRVFFIEVKARLRGRDTSFEITANEVTFAQTQRDRHRLALVSVDPDDPARDEVRYVVGAFAGFHLNDATRSTNEDWTRYWDKGGEPG